jgi:hypothetical protein
MLLIWCTKPIQRSKKNPWAQDKDLDKNTDEHSGSFWCRRNEQRKLTGGLEEPQIWAVTEKSQAAKTTQGRRTKLKREINSLVSRTMEQSDHRRASHKSKREKTGDRGLDTNSQQKQRSRGHEHLSRLDVAHHKSKVKWITHTRSKNNFFSLKSDTIITDLQRLLSSLPHLIIKMKIYKFLAHS